MAHVADTRACKSCEQTKPLGEFAKYGGGRYRHVCKSCKNTALQRWRADNPEVVAEYAKRWADGLRAEVLEHYGARCACCGEEAREFLTIEHIEGVPDSHRDKHGKRMSPRATLVQIKREGFPSSIEILCFNCNAARSIYGACPHSRALRAVA